MHLEMTELAGVLDFSSVWGGEGTAIGTQPVSLNAFKFIQCLQPVHFFSYDNIIILILADDSVPKALLL